MSRSRPCPAACGIPPRRIVLAALAAVASSVAAATWPSTAIAQSWPARPVKIVIPYGPGGPNDVVARLLAEHLRKTLGQPFVVENKPGAAGVLGSAEASRAAPDGYTLLFSNSAALVVQSVLKSPPPYDPSRAFTPVIKLADAPTYIGVNADLPVTSLAELVALARREPGKLSYTTTGIGSFGQFLGEYLKLVSGTSMVHVPGKGTPQALSDLIAGHVQVMIDPGVLSQRGGGRVRVLAGTDDVRSEAYPDVPTVKEAGFPELNIVGWFGLLGPAGLPRDVVERLDAAARTMLADPEARRLILAQGLKPAPAGSEAFAEIVRKDMKTYADIKARAGIQAD